MLAFRIADLRHPIFDSTGARLKGGRWNSPGRGVIYAAQTYAGALLEVLVHLNLGELPRNHGVITITVPGGVEIESMTAEDRLRWKAADLIESRAFGDRWLRERRTAVLCVPSIVLQGREDNILINPAHNDADRILAGIAEKVVWDTRLFPGSDR